MLGKNKNQEEKKGGDVDLAEDLVFALSNLVAAEDHAKGSYIMNQDNPVEAQKWIQVIDAIRIIRTRWLKVFVKEENSQLWCVTKHLLAASMGLSEVANRFNNVNRASEAETGYKDSGEIMGAIFILNGYKEVGNDV